MSIPYFDAHCDTPVPVHYRGGSLYENSFHLDLKRLKSFSPCAQVFSLCVNHDENMTRETGLVLNTLLQELDKYPDSVRLCRSAKDIKQAQAEGLIAALISIEGAEKLDCDIAKLAIAKEKGVSIVHITWNHDNALSGAAMDSGSGLTEKGREFVQVAQQIGVVLDMSHISERGFWDVLEIAERPVLAGHSDAAGINPAWPRNLSDGQFEALVRIGGVAGLNLCRDFLGLGENVEAVVAHAEHYLALGGERTVCLGTDFDGIDKLPDGIDGVQAMGAFYEAMLRKNWSESLVRDIFYNNLMSFMESVL